ncbi:hypothetical protein D9758_002392 [Tetrapyrgos nigripes]|uniref:ribonuclease H n=1 Tax=Tetrapyrgos nigripes TaxID=182062 RepID=A0A8H5GPI6_9AGAR|nr:hypothetical protein D9758_002392 [Tetrapyrgos nigripes]
MAKGKPSFYAVSVGRVPGIYETWDECTAQVKGYPGARYKLFRKLEEAKAWNGKYSNDKEELEADSEEKQAESSVKLAVGVAASSSKSLPNQDPDDSKGKKRAFDTEVTPSFPKIHVSGETGGNLVVYCDGACKGNGQPGSVAGVGVWWGYGDERNIAERCPGAQTNNRAELIALARVLESTPVSQRKLTIKTDSQYTINCFEKWIFNWRQNNWKNASSKPVANAPLIRYVSALLSGRVTLGQKVQLEYVKGHSGDEGNDGADRQANYGAVMSEVEERDWEQLEEYYEKEVARIKEELERKDMDPNEAEMKIVGSQEIPDGVDAEMESADAGQVNGESPTKRRRISEEDDRPTLAGPIPGPFSPTRPRSKPASAARLAAIQGGLSPSKPDPEPSRNATSVASPSKSSREPNQGRSRTFQEPSSLTKPDISDSKKARLAAIEACLSPSKPNHAAVAENINTRNFLPSSPSKAASPSRETVPSPTKSSEPSANSNSNPVSFPKPKPPSSPSKQKRLALLEEGLSPVNSTTSPVSFPKPKPPSSPTKRKRMELIHEAQSPISTSTSPVSFPQPKPPSSSTKQQNKSDLMQEPRSPVNSSTTSPRKPKPLSPRKQQRLAFIEEGLSPSKPKQVDPNVEPMPKLDLSGSRSFSSTGSKGKGTTTKGKGKGSDGLSDEDWNAFAEGWDRTPQPSFPPPKKARSSREVAHAPQETQELTQEDLEAYAEGWDDDLDALK